ncbi:hypothetical protein [Prevotella sp.]|uniref:hypothetical protein n=1 Tax=Prevotella sp. TaxID=59823 RepID=UPI002A8096F7|nr:hypothetical protein [Prevotella sp.]
MNTLHIKFIFLCSIALFFSTTMNAQTRQELEKELKFLKARKETLLRELKAAEKDYKTQKGKLKKLQPMKSRNDSTLKGEDLETTITRLQTNNDSLRNELAVLRDSLNGFEMQREELEKFKKNAADKFFERNSGYLQRHFNEMSIIELEKIRERGNELGMTEFVKTIDATKRNKKIFDKASTILNNKYNESAINGMLQEIEKTSFPNDIQKEDMEEKKRLLNVFKEGLGTFKDLIAKYAQYRNTIFSESDVNEQIVIITNNIGKEGMDKIKDVPYLKRKYDEYIKELKKNPKSREETETEKKINNQ